MTEPDTPTTAPSKRKFTRFLLTGLATLLPTVLTGYIVYVCYRFVHSNLGQWIAVRVAQALGQWDPVTREITNSFTAFVGDLLAVVIVLGGALSVGALAGSFIGRKVIQAVEHFLLKVPFIKVIYPYVKQVTDFILSEKKVTFRKVVAVPYPRVGIYSLGFVTGQGWRTINELAGDALVQVFIPNSPMPATGYVIFVRRSEIVDLDITVDEALRFTISGGVIVPPRELMPDVPPAVAPPVPTDDAVAPRESVWAKEE